MDQTEPHVPDHIPDFQGRVVFVYLAGQSVEHGQYLVNPRIEKQCGRYFLAGAAAGNYRMAGHPFCIAWDRVEAYMVADSLEEFSRKLQSADGDAPGRTYPFKLHSAADENAEADTKQE